jgi:60 kDa SS-A/Ro ribonucleoprotein
MNRVQANNFGRTDCSLPMELAIKDKLEIDTFVVITDNETYEGARHPHVALEDYRQKSGIDAKLVVMGMTATQFTIANPKDRGMLDVVGADANTPKVVAEFSAGRI